MSGGAAPQVVRGVLDAAACARWLAAVDECAALLPGDHTDRQPTSDSLRLAALGQPWLTELEARVRELGLIDPAARCLREHCWARRQHPPAARPPGTHAHHWHQDGALGVRFEVTAAATVITPRPITTVWTALTACGADAPSLEWIAVPFDRLLYPNELDDAMLLQRHGVAARRQAVLDTGDALVFDGSLLHRTHSTPAMTCRRVGLELRFEPTPIDTRDR